MLTTRIRSQHGNVIAADFRPRTSLELTFTLETETLYCDGAVTLLRTVGRIGGRIGGKPAFVTHFLGNLATGHIVHL